MLPFRGTFLDHRRVNVRTRVDRIVPARKVDGLYHVSAARIERDRVLAVASICGHIEVTVHHADRGVSPSRIDVAGKLPRFRTGTMTRLEWERTVGVGYVPCRGTRNPDEETGGKQRRPDDDAAQWITLQLSLGSLSDSARDREGHPEKLIS